MNTLDIERRVRDTLARQASALQPPDVRPDDAVVIIGPSPAGWDRRPRRRVLLAAAAVLVIGAGLAVAARHSDSTVEPGSRSGGPFHAATQTVEMDAASLTVDANGRTFAPPADTDVHSDPGTINQYTTLELEWNDGDTPMRVYMYFTSDGTDWWANELRTYDGTTADPKWIEMTGEFFRTPLRSAFHGDFDQQSLHIHGMTLQAFPPPAACSDTSAPVAAQSGYSKVEAQAGGGFGVNVTLVDTATCTPVPVDGYDVSVSVDDANIATAELSGLGVPLGMVNIQLQLHDAGTTTLHVVVTDKATGQPVDQVDIPVIVH